MSHFNPGKFLTNPLLDLMFLAFFLDGLICLYAYPLKVDYLKPLAGEFFFFPQEVFVKARVFDCVVFIAWWVHFVASKTLVN